MGITVAIYASLFLALSQASLKKSFRELPSSVAFLFDAIFALVLWIPLALFMGVHLDQLWAALPYAIVSAILSEALFFYALTKGQLSITSILLGSYAIYTVLFSFFLNGEHLSQWQLLAVTITILGTLLVYLPSKFSWSELKQMGAVLWPLAAAVGIGLSDTLSKGFIDKSGDYSFLFALALVQIPVAFIYLRLEKQGVMSSLTDVFSQARKYKQILAGSFFNVVGTGLLWVSFTYTLASIASPITATSGALVVLFAVFLLDEDLNWRSALALVLVFIGIMGIALTS